MKVSSNVWMSSEIWGIETAKNKNKRIQQRKSRESLNIPWNLSTWF